LKLPVYSTAAKLVMIGQNRDGDGKVRRHAAF
jgi:hypothetical protein